MAAAAVNRLGGMAINQFNPSGPNGYGGDFQFGQSGNPSPFSPYANTGFDSGAAGVDTGYATIPYYGGSYDPNGGIGGIQREQFSPNTGTYAPPISYMPNIPTMPQVNAQGPWQGLGTSTGNVFSGGSLGSWANGSNVQNNTAASQAWGGQGQATQGNQWTGISGDAARSFFGGMSTGATDALQHEAMMAMKLQQQ